MTTLLGTYVGAPTTTHVITIGSPTPGRDVFVAVGAAATLSSPSAPWTRIGYLVAFTAGGIYHLPAADNDGSITTLSVTLNGPRQLTAVAWEDLLDGSPTVASNAQSGYLTGTTITTGAFTAVSGVGIVAVMGINGPSDPVIPAISSFNQGLSVLGSTTPAATSDEESITSVGWAENVDFAAETVTATYAGSWAHSSVALLVTYEVVTAPSGTAALPGGSGAMTATGRVTVRGTAALPGGSGALTATVDDEETPGTAVYTVKRAIVERMRELSSAPGDVLWGLNVLDRIPTTKADLRGPTGYIMIFYPTESDGTVDVQVLTGGALKFDETSTLTFRIEVIGRTTSDTQPVVDRLAGRVLRNVLAELSSQQTWNNRVSLGMDRYDYLWFTPSEVNTLSTRVDGIPAAGAGISLGVQIRARHSYGG